MPKIFISHSWDDNAVSKKLAEYLKRDGAEIWIDYARISGGDSLPEVIGQAIEWCDTLVLVWSRSAATSYYVKLEWTTAISNLKRVIPCVLDDTKLPTILTGLLYVALCDFDGGYESLARGLKLAIKTAPPTPPAIAEKVQIPSPVKSEPVKQAPVQTPILRNHPLELSEADVKRMLIKKHLFDSGWNKKGTGFDNIFIEQTLSNDKVVLDKASGLMWQQGGSANTMIYEQAEHWLKNLNKIGFATYYDWRLPTLEETMSLMESKKNKDQLYINPIFDRQQRDVWTCDKVQGQPWAWVVAFNLGVCSDIYDPYSFFSVRAVRSAQSSALNSEE